MSARRRTWVLLVLILLLAAGLRFLSLDAQSLWNDEGNSARLAERPLPLILAGARGDIHPPGYYLLLWAWRSLAGQTEFALRAPSALAGLVLVTFTYLIGARLFGTQAGLAAAFLSALSPLAIYYSQEARMYALLAALGAVTTYFLLRLFAAWERPGVRARVAVPILYMVISALGLYTQYTYPFLLLVQNALFGIWWVVGVRRRPRFWRPVVWWAAVQAGILFLFLPWLPTALHSVTHWSVTGGHHRLGAALLDIWRVLIVGVTLPTQQGAPVLLASAVLLIAGLWPQRRAGPRGQTPLWLSLATAALYLLLPVAAILAFGLYRPAYRKFLLLVLPPLHLLLARGMGAAVGWVGNLVARDYGDQAGRRRQFAEGVSWVALLLLAALSLWTSLDNLYFDPAYARADYRQMAADIVRMERQGQQPDEGGAVAVVLNAPNQWEVFTYYHADEHVFPAPYHPTLAEVEAFLTPILSRYSRIVVLYWGDAEADPQRLVERWLAEHAYRAEDRWVGDVRFVTYGTGALPSDSSTALDAVFDGRLLLQGYAPAVKWRAAGQIMRVTLFWQASEPLERRYKVTLQLLDSTGRLVAQRDSEPRDGLAPTDSWTPGQVVRDRYGILLLPDLPAGTYRLAVGAYDAVTGQRAPAVVGGEEVAGGLLVVDEVDISPTSWLPPARWPSTEYHQVESVSQPAAGTQGAGVDCCQNWSDRYQKVRDAFDDGDKQWYVTELGLLRVWNQGDSSLLLTRPTHQVLDWGLHALAPGDEGDVWLAADDGIWRLQGLRWEHVLPTAQPVQQLMRDGDGTLWAAGYGDRMVQPDQLLGRAPGHMAPSIVYGTVYHRLDDEHWEIWSGPAGLYTSPSFVVGADHCQRWRWVSPPSLCSAVPHEQPAMVDLAGRGYATGIPQSETPFPVAFSTLALAPDGALWAGSEFESGGIVRFEDNAWSAPPVSDPASRSCMAASALLIDSLGRVWSGTPQGLCRATVGGATLQPSEVVTGAVTVLAEDWQGQVWVGLAQGGLVRLEHEGRMSFNVSTGALPDDRVTALAVDRVHRRLYVGTHGGLVVFDGRSWDTLGNPAEPMWINALAVDDQGQVWVGAYAGPDDQGRFAGDLHVYSEEGWRRVGLPIDAGVSALAVDADGRLWVGLIPAGFLGRARFALPTRATGAAVLSYRPGEWRRVGPEQGLGLPAVFALQVDPEGRVWAGGALGVAAIKPGPIWDSCG